MDSYADLFFSDKNVKCYVLSVELTEIQFKIARQENSRRERIASNQGSSIVEAERSPYDLSPPFEASESQGPPSRPLSVISRESTPIYEDISMFPFGQPVANSLGFQNPDLSLEALPQVDDPTSVVLPWTTPQIDDASKDVPTISTTSVDDSDPDPLPYVVVNTGFESKSNIDYKALVMKQQWKRGLRIFPNSRRMAVAIKGVPRWVFDSQQNKWFAESTYDGSKSHLDLNYLLHLKTKKNLPRAISVLRRRTDVAIDLSEYKLSLFLWRRFLQSLDRSLLACKKSSILLYIC